jgi:hypothetical protein
MIRFPDAKTFGATTDYFAEIHAETVKRERAAEKAKEATVASHVEDEKCRTRAPGDTVERSSCDGAPVRRGGRRGRQPAA